MRWLGLAGALSFLATNALAATQAGPVAPRPPHERPEQLSSVEAGLWAVSDKAEIAAKHSGDGDMDPVLAAYIHSVECRVAPEYCDDIRFYVMDRPLVNSFMAPNGYAEIWSGLLLGARNEAELAFALAHETTHFANRHAVADLNRTARTMAVTTIITLGIGGAGMYGAAAMAASNPQAAQAVMNQTGRLIDIVYLSGLASVFRFSREQEAEADRGGFDRLVAAGYDPHAAGALWKARIQITASSSLPRVRRSGARSNLFDDHPLDGERMVTMEAAAAKAKPGGDLGVARFRAAIRPHLAAWLRDDLRRRDFGETLALIDGLRLDGADEGALNFYRGECYRERRDPGDTQLALAAYTTAATYSDTPAETWRELGDLLRRDHREAEAVSAYRTYLQHAPNASDRWLVEASLKSPG